MWVIDHFLYAGLYLPACSCFTDCPCSRGWGPYGTVFYWRSDCTADEVLLFLRRNLLEEEKWTPAPRSCMTFTRLLLNSQSVFRCSNKAAGRRWHFASAQEPPTPPVPHSQVGPQFALHILQKAPQRGDVYYDAKLLRWDAITTLCISFPAYCTQGWMQFYSAEVQKTLQRRKAA